jgi:hypothetical protein
MNDQKIRRNTFEKTLKGKFSVGGLWNLPTTLGMRKAPSGTLETPISEEKWQKIKINKNKRDIRGTEEESAMTKSSNGDRKSRFPHH